MTAPHRPRHPLAVFVLAWLGAGGLITAASQFRWSPLLAAGAGLFGATAVASAFALWNRRNWAPVALRVNAFAVIGFAMSMLGMTLSSPQIDLRKVWLAYSGALALWVPFWVWFAYRVQREIGEARLSAFADEQ